MSTYKTYKKKHIKIFQNGRVIFNRDCYVCVDGENTCSSTYFYMTDRTKRRLKICEKSDGSHETYITLGIADTVFIEDSLTE